MEKERQLQIYDALIQEIKSNSSILHCHRFDESSSLWKTTYHEHDYFEFLYFIKGQAHIQGDNSRAKLGINDLIIYPPHFGHKEFIDFSKHQEAFCLGLALNSQFTFSEALTISDPQHLLEWLFTQLHLLGREKQDEIIDQIKILLFQYIKKCFLDNGEEQQPISVRVINYLEHHYREKIYQKDLADLVNVSSAYMYKIFKEETDQTPIDYLNRLRISKALSLIDRNNITLEEIGPLVGIPDTGYLSKLFKKYTGSYFHEWRSKT